MNHHRLKTKVRVPLTETRTLTFYSSPELFALELALKGSKSIEVTKSSLFYA